MLRNVQHIFFCVYIEKSLCCTKKSYTEMICTEMICIEMICIEMICIVKICTVKNCAKMICAAKSCTVKSCIEKSCTKKSCTKKSCTETICAEMICTVKSTFSIDKRSYQCSKNVCAYRVNVWCPRQDSNLWLSAPEADALSPELRGHVPRVA